MILTEHETKDNEKTLRGPLELEMYILLSIHTL